jgi:hypothetical protein
MSTVQRVPPPSKPTGWVKDPTSDKSVESAKAAMHAAKEPFVSKITGQVIQPKYLGKADAGSAPVEKSFVAPKEDYASELPPQLQAKQAAQRRARVAPARVAQTAAQLAAEPATQPTPNDGRLHFDLDGGGAMDIFQDPETRLWFLEIQQAPDEFGTPGVERFTSRSKDELLPILGKAKAAASGHIRRQTRVIKSQRISSLDSWDTFYATRNLTQIEVNTMDAKTREIAVDGIQVIHIQQFMNEHPGYLNQQTWQPIENFLKRQNASFTKRNIEYACQELGINFEGRVAAPAAPEAAATPVATPAARAPTPAPRKRASYSSSLVPGSSSAAGGGPLHDGERQPAQETEAQRAKRLASTPEGLAQLRGEAILSLSQARPRR